MRMYVRHSGSGIQGRVLPPPSGLPLHSTRTRTYRHFKHAHTAIPHTHIPPFHTRSNACQYITLASERVPPHTQQRQLQDYTQHARKETPGTPQRKAAARHPTCFQLFFRRLFEALGVKLGQLRVRQSACTQPQCRWWQTGEQRPAVLQHHRVAWCTGLCVQV